MSCSLFGLDSFDEAEDGDTDKSRNKKAKTDI
jgi:hypothetical protein